MAVPWLGATADLARIRYVTANYGGLQGLRLVPLGVALLLATPLYAGWHFAQSGRLLALWLLPLAVGLVLYGLVGAYYARTVGRVQPTRRAPATRRERLARWLGRAAFLALFLVTPRLGSPRLALVGFSVVLCAALLASLWRAGALRPRLHWVALAALLAGLNLLLQAPLPLLRPDRWSDYALFAIWVGSVSVGLIVGGCSTTGCCCCARSRRSRGKGRGSAMRQPFEDLAGLDKLVHEPARLAILTALAACTSADSLFLQRLTGLTTGNLSTHLGKLEEGCLVRVEKGYVGTIPNTVLSLTDVGHDTIEGHWRRLEQLRQGVREWRRAPQDADTALP